MTASNNKKTAVEEQVETELVSRLRAAPPAQRLDSLKEYLRSEVMELLASTGTPRPLDGSKSLREQGLNSLGYVRFFVKVKAALGEPYGDRFSVPLLLKHPTLDGIAEYLYRQVLPFGDPID